ncbi:MAG: hypothetical protein ACI9JN_001746 [Bacteroidia bacterium]|jgi:hypothetical protein
MKRHILKDLQEYPNRIYAIVCTKPFTQLVWNLSETLDIPFIRGADVLQQIDGSKLSWARCLYVDKDLETTYSVVKNKGVDNKLAPELRNVDAFLIETNHSLTFQLGLEKISKTTFVDFCFEVKHNMINQETDFLLYLE